MFRNIVKLSKRPVENQMWKLTQLVLIYAVLPVSVYTLERHRIEFTALDCRTPKGLIRSKVSALCKHTQHKVESAPKLVHILQFDKARILNAYTCSLKKTTVLAYCGSFSHQKIYEPIDVLRSEPVSRDVCKQAFQTHLYTQEDGRQATISVNRPYNYKYLSHGKLTATSSNVKCEGEQFAIHGKSRSNMLSMITAQFTLHRVSIETGPEKVPRDLDSGYDLPNHCIADRYCYAFGKMYIITSPRSVCPLYLVRSLKMIETQYIGADGQTHVALVSHEHQLILEQGTRFHLSGQCTHFPVVYNTNYQKLKVITDQNTSAKLAVMKSFTLDLSLQTQVLHDYANYRAESLVDTQIDNVLHSLCETNKFGLHEAERDPFKMDYLLKRSGELYTRFKCVNVTVVTRVGDNKDGKCYKDALPVFLGREKLILMANTRTVLSEKDAEVTVCSEQFPPVFFAKDGKSVVANPTVQVVNFTLAPMGHALYPMHKKNMHETAQHFSLYTESEIRDFNFLLHFGRAKKAVLAELTGKYCSGQDCGSVSYAGVEGSFDLNRLKAQIESSLDVTQRLKHALRVIGETGGCTFMIFIIFKIICKIAEVHYLYAKRNTTLRFALSTSLYRERGVNELLLTNVRNEVYNMRENEESKT